MHPRRPSPWLFGVPLVVGLALVFGGLWVLRDQRSGVAGTAKVTSCDGGGGKYSPGVRCQGIWQVGGSLVFEDGQIVSGPVEGAGSGDVGKTIDVRIHGSDHVTVPGLGMPIALWAIGSPIALLSLWGLGRGRLARRRAPS
jgi:hypothetical protein